MELHEKIKKLRTENKLSQGELAKSIGVHNAHLSKLEKGQYTPSLEVIKKLAEVFGVTIDYLVSNRENPEEVEIEDKSLYERVKLIESLDNEEKKALMKIIDSMLTKKQISDLLQKTRAVS